MSVSPAETTANPRTPLHNTAERFGRVAKALHWLTALLIFKMIILGVVAEKWPYDSSEALAVKATLFSIHKTLGLFTFAVALTRILWAVIQPRPAMLPTGSRMQEFAAEAVHYSLYIALVLVPLSGWIHHAATSGFAPIWWPFGQTLFFVPQSEVVAETAGQLHFYFILLLVGSLVLHIAGALKHHLIDRDATLRRMLPGTPDLPDLSTEGHTGRAPILAAVLVWLAALGTGIALTERHETAPVTALDTAASGWAVEAGTLSIAVRQLGQTVEGQFADWTAAIEFSEEAADGQHGMVEVTVAIPSLTLGGVTEQALSAEFLSASEFATGVFSGPILADEGGYVVDGTLTLVGQTHPLRLPFDLALDGDNAAASGEVTLDRRTYAIGQTYPDESSVGFPVIIRFDLTARQDEDPE